MPFKNISKKFKILLIVTASVLLSLLLVPTYFLFKNIQNDMPLREYVKVTLIPRLKTDLKRFFTFSKNSSIDIPVLFLEIEPAELKKLNDERVSRIAEIEKNQNADVGQDHWKFVNAKVILNQQEHLIKIRIRGDMPSNFNRGIERASLRFNIESNTALFGKKKLSLVRAFLESNFYGFLFSRFLDQNGFIANNVKFVRLVFNGEDTGICFLEEGFSKELLESSDYRDGVILRFKNDCMDNNGSYNNAGIPELVAYNEKRVIKDSVLSGSYNRALSKFDLLKDKKITVTQCFNTDKFARYLALCDIFLAHHSYVCHNTKLYFNPINDKFEPIAWDPSSFMRYKVRLPVHKGFNSVSGEVYDNRQSYPLYNFLFSDTLFLKNFNRHLSEFSHNTDFALFIKENEDIIGSLDPILYRQRFQEQFHPDFLLGNIQNIKNWFSTDTRLTAKMFRHEGILVVNSTLPLAIELKKLKLDSGSTLPINKILLPYQSDTIRIGKMIKSDDYKFTLFSSIYGFEDGQKYKGNIFEKMDQYNTPFISEKTDSSLLKFDIQTKSVSFRDKIVTLNQNLFIPPGNNWIIPAGAQIELRNNANIISESPLVAIGRPDKKIKFHSDGSGGIFIKNTLSPSTLEYVEFDNLSNPVSDNWSLTGAVTFYESEVTLGNCVIINNLSEDAINIIRSHFFIHDCFVSHTFSDAIDMDFSNGKIINTTIENTQNDGLDFSGSQVELHNINLSRIGDKGVSGGENTSASIENINIKDSFIGISSKDKSIVKTENLEILNTKIPFTSYQKKPEYGPATIVVKNFKGKVEKNDYRIESNSLLVINGDSLKGKETNVYDKLYKKL